MLSFTTATTANSAANHNNIRQWNPDMITNMINFLGFLKTQTQSKEIERNIMTKARAYLVTCLDYADAMEAKALAQEAEESQKRQIAEENDEHAIAASSSDESIDLCKYARQGLKDEKHVRIAPDTWLSYTHKLFKMKKFTRVVEVRARGEEPRVVVENGDILSSSHQVRVLHTLPDGACDKENGYSYKALSEYKFKVGRSKKLKDLHDRVDAFSANQKLDIGGAKGGGASHGGSHGPPDDESDEVEVVFTSAAPSNNKKRMHEEQVRGGEGDCGGGAGSRSDKRSKFTRDSSSKSGDLSDSSDSEDVDAVFS
jgi:hypothetical protein